MPDKGTQDSGRTRQCGGCSGSIRRLIDALAKHRVVDRRVPQIAGDLCISDRHHRQPRILDLVFQAGCDDLGDPFGEPSRPWGVGHRSVVLSR